MSVSAIQRSLDLIELLAGAADGLEISTISERLAMPASAAHRTLATLIERGYVVQNPASQVYALSLRLAQIGFRILDTRGLPGDAGQGVLDWLALETNEYCRLAVVDGDELAWVSKAQGATGGLRYEPAMGHTIVLHATATGKAWLATLAEDEALRIVFAHGFDTETRVGPNCVRSIGELSRQLEETRRRGYATAVEEGEPGTAALAIPFRAHEDEAAPIAGTLSVAGPVARILAKQSDIAAALQRAAHDMAVLWPLRKRQVSGRDVHARSPSHSDESSRMAL